MKSGTPITALLTWTNALSSTIQDGSISVALSGEALNASNVIATNGFYQSSTRTVRYDRDTNGALALLAPGDTGNGSFTFTTKTGSALSALRNPSITLAVSVSGRRVGQSGVAESVASTITRTVKVQSDLGFGVRAVRTSGPYANTGPWPPEADKESTYTILLAASNSVNTVAKTEAVMTLPSYVRFTGQTSGSSIKYNETTRQVTWSLGDFAPASTRDASFQVALLPSVSQKGTSPTLVSEAVLSGFDRFVQRQLEAVASAVDTDIKSDPAYQSNNGTVKQ